MLVQSLHPSLLCSSIYHPSPILTRFLFQWHRKTNTTLPLSCIHIPPHTPLAHKYPSLHPSLDLLFSLYFLIPLSRLNLPATKSLASLQPFLSTPIRICGKWVPQIIIIIFGNSLRVYAKLNRLHLQNHFFFTIWLFVYWVHVGFLTINHLSLSHCHYVLLCTLNTVHV